MIDYHYLLKTPSLFQSFTGLSLKQFKAILPVFSSKLEQFHDSFTRDGHLRKRNPGAGVNSEIFDKPSKLLAFTLFFIRCYPTFSLAQILYQIDRASLHHWFHLGLLILEQSVGYRIHLPAKKTLSLQELLLVVPELKEHITDATEQPINRPKYNQKHFYSGKKKRHTIKRQIIVTPNKKLISISHSVEGKKHDKTLAEESAYMVHAPPDSTGLTDLGYLNIDTDGLSVKFVMPIKKSKGTVLKDHQKQTNKALSSIRVRVEHVIGHLKFNRIFSDKVRYRLDIDDRISNVVGGLYNFKLDFR